MPYVLTTNNNIFNTDDATAYEGDGTMYLTKSERWVLFATGKYAEQTQDQVVSWLVENGHADVAKKKLPEVWTRRELA